jgi:futalosine hydrolase
MSGPRILVVCALLPEVREAVLPPHVDVLVCGVGPVEAAIATARALATTRYAAVVNAGIAGAFRGSAHVGDAVIVEDEVLADFGLEGGGALALPEGARLADRVAADVGLLRRCGGALRRARGLTVAEVTATDATALRLRERYACDVESMEGFSVLRAAAVAQIPALEVRGISNFVGDRARSQWDFAAGARAAARALETVVQALSEESEG